MRKAIMILMLGLGLAACGKPASPPAPAEGLITDTNTAPAKPRPDRVWTSDRWNFTITLPADWPLIINDEINNRAVASFNSPKGEVTGEIWWEQSPGSCLDYLDNCLSVLAVSLKLDISDKYGSPEEAAVTLTASEKDLMFTNPKGQTKERTYLRVVDFSGTKLTFVGNCLEQYLAQDWKRLEKCAASLEGWKPPR